MFVKFNDNKIKFEDFIEEVGNKFGAKVITRYGKMSPLDILTTAPYQRKVEKARVKRIEKSMREWGYLPNSPIIINRNGEAVDGIQRREAAIRLNIPLVPITQFDFPDVVTEAKFFVMINSFNTSLSPEIFCDARVEAGEPYDTLLYKLISDPQCVLYNFVSLKGCDQTKYKFTVSCARMILNSCVFSYFNTWTKNEADRLDAKAKVMDYTTARNKMNDILGFYFDWVGKDKRSNPVPYKDSVVRAMMIAIFHLKYYGKLDPAYVRAATLDRMKKFNFSVNSGFLQFSHANKITTLLSHYNYKKHPENEVIYIPGKIIDNSGRLVSKDF